MNKINSLNKRIWQLKDKLKLDHEIKLFVTVNNRTFPRHSDDLVKRYNESYAIYNQNYKPNKNLINGNYTNIDDVYNIRKNMLQNKDNILKSSLSSINNQLINLPMFQKHIKSKNRGNNKKGRKSDYQIDNFEENKEKTNDPNDLENI
jgi:hypothetical protein